MKQLLIATTNPGKVIEFSKFLSDLPIKLISLKELKITDVVEETGKSYKENSQLKAKYYAHMSGLPAIADDGGIEIVALGGAPGIKSARWLGGKATEQDHLAHMKKVASKLPDTNRTCYFKTVISFATPHGKVWSAKGSIKGTLAKNPFRTHLKGYPYRSFFYLPRLKKYYHEKDLTEHEQKRYNHRYKAVQKLKPIIRETLDL